MNDNEQETTIYYFLQQSTATIDLLFTLEQTGFGNKKALECCWQSCWCCVGAFWGGGVRSFLGFYAFVIKYCTEWFWRMMIAAWSVQLLPQFVTWARSSLHRHPCDILIRYTTLKSSPLTVKSVVRCTSAEAFGVMNKIRIKESSVKD